MRDDEFDVGYWLLDDVLVDRDGRRCGRVDDLEFEGGPGKRTLLRAIVCGPGAWRDRMPKRLLPIAARVFGESTVKVPWSEVRDIGVVVELKRGAEELGLGRGDDALAPIIRRIPGS
jgi:sporulation protein YlmC with PRC-barrel domain